MFAYRLFLFLLSRPAFFGFWLLARKLSAHALNMSSASRLPCDQTGERLALRYVLSKRKNGRPVTILDVGANVGQFTNLCLNESRLSSDELQVYSFEPHSTSADVLNRRFQDDARVHVYNVGMSKEKGRHPLYFPWHTCAGASSHPAVVDLWPTTFKGNLMQEEVSFDTVDNFVSTQSISLVLLLKIDVEGAEFHVIEGAKQAIDQGLVQFIQFEISPGTMLNKLYLYDFWRELSRIYKFYLIFNQGIAEVRKYDGHLENFVGATNYLLELRD